MILLSILATIFLASAAGVAVSYAIYCHRRRNYHLRQLYKPRVRTRVVNKGVLVSDLRLSCFDHREAA